MISYNIFIFLGFSLRVCLFNIQQNIFNVVTFIITHTKSIDLKAFPNSFMFRFYFLYFMGGMSEAERKN